LSILAETLHIPSARPFSS